jgi:hypothetical protein
MLSSLAIHCSQIVIFDEAANAVTLALSVAELEIAHIDLCSS